MYGALYTYRVRIVAANGREDVVIVSARNDEQACKRAVARRPLGEGWRSLPPVRI